MSKITPTKEIQTCPCCDQLVKLYMRSISGGMAKDLVKLYSYADKYMHITTFSNTHGGDFAKLAYWDLVSTYKSDNPKSKSSGMWRVTDKGILFLERKLSIPKYVFLYNKKVHGFSDDLIGIDDTFKESFSYAELMYGDHNE
jgi:hypothetical protein